MERNSYNPASSLKHLCSWTLLWPISLFFLLLPPAAAGIYITELCSEERWISTSIKSCFHSEIYYHPQHAAAWMQRIWKKMSHGAAGSVCGVEMELLRKERMGITHQTWLLEEKTRERWEEVSITALVAGLGNKEATGRALGRGSWGARESGILGRSDCTAAQSSHSQAEGSSPGAVWEWGMLVVPAPVAGSCTAVPCSTHRTHLGHS